ncbi:MAG: sel1 repeat family protein [Muribaculaceae bacterium]|nr:sel1 repeat family protein [Muribaculaceae bacterium]
MKQIFKTISLSAVAVISLSTPTFATHISEAGDDELTSEEKYYMAMYYFQQENYEDAIPLLQEAARQGDEKALNALGKCYEHGVGVYKDHTWAVKYHILAAYSGNADSQNIIGECYLYGDILALNKKEAAQWFEKAAIKGNNKAQYNLGLCYYYGWGVKKNYKLAAYWFNKSMMPEIKEDDLVEEAPLAVNVAIEDYCGTVSKSKEDYYYDAINGDPVAQYELAKLYIEDNNTQEAIKWLTMAEQGGFLYAQDKLAQIYAEAHDYDNAFYWFKKTKDCFSEGMGIGDMLYSLAFYTNDNNYPIFLQEAVNRGNINALVDLACLYAMGELVERDDNKAVELYCQYVQNLDDSLLDYYGVSKQNITIANVYFYIYKEWFHISRGDLESKAEIPFLKKAAELGHCEAQLTVGYLYNCGDEYYEFEQDYVEAAKLFTKAANQGNAYAQFMLGDYYNEGKGVKKNYKKAAQWYKKAADQGIGDALYQLAEYHANGYGVKKDMTLADEYYKKAADAYKTKAEEHFDNNE